MARHALLPLALGALHGCGGGPAGEVRAREEGPSARPVVVALPEASRPWPAPRGAAGPPAAPAEGGPDDPGQPGEPDPRPTTRTDYSPSDELDISLQIGGPTLGEVVRAWAPVWYHDVAFRGPDGLGPKADFYMALDYDGDLRHDDNWDELPDHEIRSALYYAFVATETHWFLTFSQYHARDWELICTGLATECHEGDMEHVRLVLVAYAGPDGLGEPLLVLTDAHGRLHTWSAQPGSEEFGPPVDWEDAGGAWFSEASPAARRLRVFTQAKGHGPIPCRARESAPILGWWGFLPGEVSCEGAPYEDRFPGGDGLVFRPDAFEAAPYFDGVVAAGAPIDYALLAYVDELWPHRRAIGDGLLFDAGETLAWVGGRGDPAWSFDEPIGVRFDPDQFPVEGYGKAAWGERLEGSERGDLFFDPAHAVAARFPAVRGRPEGWATDYVYNPYAGPTAPPGPD